MRIIHFSDFHLDYDQIKRSKDLVSRMIQALKQVNQEKAIDVIVFSGDLIDRAGCNFPEPKMRNGFKQFEEIVIKPITTALKLPANRFVFAPGNHDVDQEAETEEEENKLKEELNNQQALDVFIHQKDIANKIPRIKEYNTFRDDYWNNIHDVEKIITPLQLGIKIKIGGLTVGFNCMNTAWRCYDSQTDKEKILTGKSQITDMIDFFNYCDLRFAVGHHMPAFMNHFESGDLEKVIARNYDAIFYGHSHEEESKYEIRPEGSCFFFNASGSLCSNISAYEPHKNGFMVIDYEQDEHHVEARRYWQNENEDFVQNMNYAGTGVWKYNIPGSRILKPMAMSLFKIKKTVGFLENDKTADCIEKLRNPANKTIQFIALSGIGKTRILQEAFNDGVIRPNSYYCEYSDDVVGLMYDIGELFDSHRGEDGLLVLDNCPNNIIEQAVSKRDSYASKFRIVGVNNEYYDRNSLVINDVLPIVVSQDDMRDVVDEYIRINTPDSNGDTTVRDQIMRLADGFPGMAIELVEAYKREKGVDIHRVDYLVKKMLKFEAGHADDHEIAMRTLALFKPFPYKVNNKEIYKFLRNNEHITPLEGSSDKKRAIFSKVIDQHDGSLIECSGDWLNVRPFPLAVWLVDKWFEDDNDEERMTDIMADIAGLDERNRHLVVEGMCERLRYMQDSADAQEMVARLMGEKGSFCNEKVVCSDLGSRLFLAMSSVNPVAIAHCLNTVLMPKSINWVKKNVDGDVRRNLVWALEKLCFDGNSYQDACKVMALFAVAENEKWGNNATGQFKQLFHIYLPGTEAPLVERCDTLEYLLSAGSDYQELLLDSLDSAFDNGHFARDGSCSKFGFETKTDYAPKSNKEIIDYWMACSSIMLQVLEKDKNSLNRISKIIEDHAIRWSMDGMLARLFPMIEQVASKKGGEWGELYTAMNRTKSNRLSFYPKDFLKHYEAFKNDIKPKSFCQKLKDARQQIYNDFKTPIEQQIENERAIFRPLAEAFVKDGIYESIQEIKLIAEDKEYNDIWFSPALKDFMNEEQVKTLMGIFMNLIRENGGDAYRSSFVFRFCSVFRDNMAFDTLLDEILKSGYLDLYMRLLSHCETDNFTSYHTMRKEMEEGRLGTDAPVRYLNYVSLQYQHQLCEMIKRFRSDYHELHDDLMDYVVRHQFDKEMFADKEVFTIIKDLILEYGIKNGIDRNIYEYSRFVADVLEHYHDDVMAAKLNRKLMGVMKKEFLRTNVQGIYAVLIKSYTNAIWRDFSRAFKDNKYLLFLFQIKDEIGSGSGFGAGPLFQIDRKRVECLCTKYPDYAPHIVAEMCPIFRYDPNKDKLEGSAFHSWVYWLLDNFGNQDAVLDGLHANMCSFAWSGSVIPLLERRKECLEKIIKHPRVEVGKWAELCIKEVDEEYTRENNREEYMRLHYN